MECSLKYKIKAESFVDLPLFLRINRVLGQLSMKRPRHNQRKTKRLESKTGIAVTEHCIAQVINLSENGVSLKCLEKKGFPNKWLMDIFDATGYSLEQLQVKKIWEKSLRRPSALATFLMEVGGSFENLSSVQEAQLKAYLRKLEAKKNNI